MKRPGTSSQPRIDRKPESGTHLGGWHDAAGQTEDTLNPRKNAEPRQGSVGRKGG